MSLPCAQLHVVHMGDVSSRNTQPSELAIQIVTFKKI